MKIVFSMVLLLMPFLSFAQEIAELKVVGKTEILQGELIDQSRRDVNGEIAAGLVILTDLKNLSFDARNGLVGDIKKEVGQYFLFLSPSERIITVRAEGYKPLTLFLYDIGVRLKSGQVWKIEITGDKQGNLIPINITVNQVQANVTIDGTQVDITKPILKAEGEHQIRIEKVGFRTIVETINISNQKTLFQFNMEQVSLQAIVIRTNPVGAAIFLDDVFVGTSPYQEVKYPGLYQLKIVQKGYSVINQVIELTEKEKIDKSFNLQKFVAVLKLDIQPSDANIQINKTDYGSSKLVELPGGQYLVEVSKDGYVTESQSIVLKELEEKTLRFSLKQLFGNLQVKVNDPDADVVVYTNLGKIYTQFKGLNLVKDIPVGVYRVVASRNGYTDISKSVTIKRDDLTSLDIQFTDEQKTAYIEQQRIKAKEDEDKRKADLLAKQRADEIARRKTAQKFKIDPFTMLGVEYAAPTYEVLGEQFEGETFGFNFYDVTRDGIFTKFGFDYTTFSATSVIDGESYNDNYAYRMYIEYGFGVNFSNLYMYMAGMADLVDFELENWDDAEFISKYDVGIGASIGAILHFDSVGLSAYYTTKLTSLGDEILYSGLYLGLHIGF